MVLNEVVEQPKKRVLTEVVEVEKDKKGKAKKVITENKEEKEN